MTATFNVTSEYFLLPTVHDLGAIFASAVVASAFACQDYDDSLTTTIISHSPPCRRGAVFESASKLHILYM